MRYTILTILAAALALFTGCTDAELARVQAVAQVSHDTLDAAEAQVESLRAQLGAMREQAAKLGDQHAVDLVTQFEVVVASAEKVLPTLRSAAASADKAVTSIKDAGEGQVPWWKVAVGVAVPILLPLLKNVPVIGLPVSAIGELAWSAYTGSQAKARQARIEAEAAALPEQVKVTHDALALVPPDAAKELKNAARIAQELNGSLQAIRPHVLQLERIDAQAAAGA